MLTFYKQKKGKSSKKNKTAWKPSGIFELALYTFGILFLIFLVLSFFAFGRPSMRTADNIQYRQTGVFYYSASGAPVVYDTDTVRSGEPVYTKLTCTINLGFVYFLVGEQLENIAGTQQIYALVLDEQSSWKRTLPLTAETNFPGNTFTSNATLDLCQVQALVASVEKETGIHLNTYTLAIVTRVSVGGKMSGHDFADIFEPRMTFNFDNLHFYIAGDLSQTDPFQTNQSRSLINPGKVENTFQLFGLNPTVRGMRVVSIIGLVISLGGLLALGMYFYVALRQNQENAIRIKYGSILMDVSDPGLETLGPFVEVTSIDDLAKLAERQNAMILHLERDGMVTYLVQVEGTTYRYVAGKGRTINPGLDQ